MNAQCGVRIQRWIRRRRRRYYLSNFTARVAIFTAPLCAAVGRGLTRGTQILRGSSKPRTGLCHTHVMSQMKATYQHLLMFFECGKKTQIKRWDLICGMATLITCRSLCTGKRGGGREYTKPLQQLSSHPFILGYWVAGS